MWYNDVIVFFFFFSVLFISSDDKFSFKICRIWKSQNFILGFGNTPAHYAAEGGKADCLNCCLQHDADLMVSNIKGDKPLDTAKKHGHFLLMERACMMKLFVIYSTAVGFFLFLWWFSVVCITLSPLICWLLSPQNKYMKKWSE